MSKTTKTEKDKSERGNTSLSPPLPKEKEHRNWFFTWNNYTETDFEDIKTWLSTVKNKKYVIGKEVGDSGTPHLQGCIQFVSAKKLSSLHKKWPKVHWEPTISTKDAEAYCRKEGDFCETLTMEEQYDKFMEEEYNGVQWYPWQEKIIDLLNESPDKRTVNWFWEEDGNTGKSFLTKYIEWKYKCIIVNGKQTDVFNGIRTYLENKKQYPEVVIVDIPRTNREYVCYGTMEKIKDGLMYSGKYEGGVIRLLPVHLIVFANFPPEERKLSEDRWEICLIE